MNGPIGEVRQRPVERFRLHAFERQTLVHAFGRSCDRKACARAGGKPELSRLGPDPLVDGLTTAVLRARLAGRSRPLKSWLLDQHLLAGLGNIYSDEVLHTARLRFDRPAGSLTARQIGALREAIDEVLAAAILAGGSTLGDNQYMGLCGEPGRYQLQHRAYGREGAPCPRCHRSTIVRARFGGRSTFFCPSCQR